MKMFMKFIVAILIISIWNISSVMAETPEEKGLRLAIEGDLTAQGFKDRLSQS